MCDATWIREGQIIRIGEDVYEKVINPLCESRLGNGKCQGKAFHGGMHFDEFSIGGRMVYIQWNDGPAWSKGAQERIANDTANRRWH